MKKACFKNAKLIVSDVFKLAEYTKANGQKINIITAKFLI